MKADGYQYKPSIKKQYLANSPINHAKKTIHFFTLKKVTKQKKIKFINEVFNSKKLSIP